MAPYAILRQSHTDSSAFEPVRESLRQAHLWQDGDGPIAEWEALARGADQRDNFGRAAAFLTNELDGREALTILVDEIDVAQMNPLRDGGWSSLIAMLIFAFPEARWVFLVVVPPRDGALSTTLDVVNRFQGPSTLTDHRGVPLFDGYGLRQAVRERMRIDAKSQGDSPTKDRHDLVEIPDRRNVAIVLDDETGFSQLEALMAYLRGFRVHAVGSWREAVELLGPNGWLVAPTEVDPTRGPSRDERIRKAESEAFLLSVEDLYLNFPDRTEAHLSRLSWRDQMLPALAKPGLLRRFVTGGHGRDSDESEKAERKSYFDDLRRREAQVTGVWLKETEQVVHKPASGLYALWEELGLLRSLPGRQYQLEGAAGYAPSYVWPPLAPAHRGGAADGHSAPGRLLQVAESLLHRAERLMTEDSTVGTAVRGTILAVEALELLGCRTPTLSLDALALKHSFEVGAECHFVGVEYHPSVDKRLQDLGRNLEPIGSWLDSKRRDEFVLNGEARIISRLIPVFEAHGAFEEAEECRDRLRILHHRLRQKAGWRKKNIPQLMSRPVTWYAELVLRSYSHFVLVIATFTAAFALGFDLLWTFGIGKGEFGRNFLKALYHAVSDMVGQIPAWDDASLGHGSVKVGTVLLTCAAASFGLLNLGLVVSLIYSKIVRK